MKSVRWMMWSAVLTGYLSVGAASRADEAKIESVLEKLDRQRRGMMNVPVEDGVLLRNLVEQVGAKHVVEIGTSNGYSGLWICLGLEKTGGRLTTHEIDAARAELARQHFREAGVSDRVKLVEGDAHEEVVKLEGPIDLLFIDADKEGYVDYLEKLLPKMRTGGAIVAHNTTDLRGPLRDYIRRVTQHPRLNTTFMHEGDTGVAISVVHDPANLKKRKPEGECILGYINELPPESPLARWFRHEKIKERRGQKPPVLVHRGASDLAPENTLEAYSVCMDLGADGVEIDPRRSKDGVIYLHHDDSIDRMTHGSGNGRDKTYYELLQAGMRKKGLATDNTRIPTFVSFLALARDRAMLIHFDIKEPGIQLEVIAMLEKADMWDHVVHVNRGHADQLQDDKRCRLLTYKGWAPEGKYKHEPEAIRNQLEREGDMIFTKDPRPVTEYLKRLTIEPTPIPARYRAWWKPEGVVQDQRPGA